MQSAILTGEGLHKGRAAIRGDSFVESGDEEELDAAVQETLTQAAGDVHEKRFDLNPKSAIHDPVPASDKEPNRPIEPMK